jgi:hypothetical protein
MKYGTKEISDYSLWELQQIQARLKNADDKREEASQHPKFNVVREIGGKNIPKMEFPPPNPEFLKLKLAIEEEIKVKTNV